MSRWGGAQSRAERRKWAPRLPVPCCRCGHPVIPDPSQPAQGWHPDHYPIRREDGGTQTWPAHARCNLRDGGRRGAQITNSRRPSTIARTRRAQSRNIRGI